MGWVLLYIVVKLPVSGAESRLNSFFFMVVILSFQVFLLLTGNLRSLGAIVHQCLGNRLVVYHLRVKRAKMRSLFLRPIRFRTESGYERFCFGPIRESSSLLI